jgi:uncharacterized Zn-binding protein involved in type VI secretion
MPGIAKVGDTVSCICCCHPPIPCIPTVGVFVAGDATVFVDNQQVVRLGDIAICACGHPTLVVAASPDVFSTNVGIARLGDPVSACPVGVIVSSSVDTFANG